jgi:hypothetical protein
MLIEYNASGYALSHLLSLSAAPTEIFIPITVTQIHQSVIDSWNYVTAYYAGNLDQWNSLMDGMYGVYWSCYTYEECKHDEYSTTWMYDKDGNISTAVPERTVSTVTEATCLTVGSEVHECVNCGDKVYYDISALPHEPDEDGKCINCNSFMITADIMDEYLTFGDTYTFEMTEDGALVSNNKGQDSTTAAMTFTATAAMKLSVNYSVSSETNFDRLVIHRDGEIILDASGAQSGIHIVELDTGDVITFEYSKDGSVSVDDDCAIINQMWATYLPQPQKQDINITD